MDSIPPILLHIWLTHHQLIAKSSGKTSLVLGISNITLSLLLFLSLLSSPCLFLRHFPCLTCSCFLTFQTFFQHGDCRKWVSFSVRMRVVHFLWQSDLRFEELSIGTFTLSAFGSASYGDDYDFRSIDGVATFGVRGLSDGQPFFPDKINWAWTRIRADEQSHQDTYSAWKASVRSRKT